MQHDRFCPLDGDCAVGPEIHTIVGYCADCETHCLCEFISKVRADQMQRMDELAESLSTTLNLYWEKGSL